MMQNSAETGLYVLKHKDLDVAMVMSFLHGGRAELSRIHEKEFNRCWQRLEKKQIFR